MMIGRFLAAGVVTLVGVGLGPAAMAASFTESVQFGIGPTDFSGSPGTTAGPNGNQLYLFDTNGGQLNSITVSYNYSVSSTITVTNSSATASSGNARVQSGAQFTADNATVSNALKNIVDNYADPVDGHSVSFGNDTLSPIAADVRGAVTTYSLAPGESRTFASDGNGGRNSLTYTDLDDLAAFSRAGGGTFTPLFTTLTGLVITNSGGNTTASQVTTAQGNLVLTFDYTLPSITTVPEPASIVLLGAGLLGLGFARRRGA